MSQGTEAGSQAGRLVWDDELWDQVWERTLGPIERHSIAMHVVRRRLPEDLFESRICAELARRWRRTSRNLALLYAIWTLFWGMLAVHDATSDGALESLLTPTNAAVGMLAIGVCLAFRAYVRPVADLPL